MRISRRFSRSAAAGAASVLTALSMAACSGSSSGSGSTASSASASQSLANANANENDVQVLNSLQITTQELDSAFATDDKLEDLAGCGSSKILLQQAWACTQNMIDTKQKSLEPVTSYFSADSLLGDPVATADRADRPPRATPPQGRPLQHPSSWAPADPPRPPTATPRTGSSAPPSPIRARTPPRPPWPGWAPSTRTRRAAADPATAPRTRSSAAASARSAPSWANSQGVFVYTDTHSHVAISVVAQRRGRYAVLTYTRGSAKADAGYYDLETGQDTRTGGRRATAVLGQLTSAVVGYGS